MYSLEQIKANLTNMDRQLLMMIYEQQIETNRLLAILANENKQDDTIPSDQHITTPLGQINRRGGRKK